MEKPVFFLFFCFVFVNRKKSTHVWCNLIQDSNQVFPDVGGALEKERAGELDWGYQSDQDTIISPKPFLHFHIFPYISIYFYIFPYISIYFHICPYILCSSCWKIYVSPTYRIQFLSDRLPSRMIWSNCHLPKYSHWTSGSFWNCCRQDEPTGDPQWRGKYGLKYFSFCSS